MFANIPEVKLGIIAVSRGCFPMALSERRRAAIKAAYGEGVPSRWKMNWTPGGPWRMCRLRA